MLDEKNDGKMKKHEREEIEEFFRERFKADKAKMLPNTDGFIIKGVIELSMSGGDKLLFGFLEEEEKKIITLEDHK